MDFAERLATIDRTTLTPVVRRAIGDDRAEVIEWQQTDLSGGSTGAGVFRLTGHARIVDDTVPWTLALKAVASQVPPIPGVDVNALRADPSQEIYWKRDLLAIQSGLLEQLPPGLRAPVCYGAFEWPEGYWLWLEAVDDRYDRPWPLERFGLAARHLGRLGGTYLGQRSLPNFPWLMRGMLRKRLSYLESFWDKLPALLDHPLIQRGFPDEIAPNLLRLLAESDTLLAALDRLPKTLQHGDTGRKNLYAVMAANGEDTTVAIDWGFLGVGVGGEELAPIVLSGLIWFNGIEPEQLPELDDIAFSGYLQGLRDSGWNGNASEVRLGYTASLALRFGVLFPEVWALDELGRTRFEQTVGRPMNEIADRYAMMRRFVLARAEEARRLISR